MRWEATNCLWPRTGTVDSGIGLLEIAIAILKDAEGPLVMELSTFSKSVDKQLRFEQFV